MSNKRADTENEIVTVPQSIATQLRWLANRIEEGLCVGFHIGWDGGYPTLRGSFVNSAEVTIKTVIESQNVQVGEVVYDVAKGGDVGEN